MKICKTMYCNNETHYRAYCQKCRYKYNNQPKNLSTSGSQSSLSPKTPITKTSDGSTEKRSVCKTDKCIKVVYNNNLDGYCRKCYNIQYPTERCNHCKSYLNDGVCKKCTSYQDPKNYDDFYIEVKLKVYTCGMYEKNWIHNDTITVILPIPTKLAKKLLFKNDSSHLNELILYFSYNEKYFNTEFDKHFDDKYSFEIDLKSIKKYTIKKTIKPY